MSGVAPSESGLASGVVNTAFMMGGALGLAILASLAASRTDDLLGSGEGDLAALNGGYHLAFLVGAVFRAAAGVSQGCSSARRKCPPTKARNRPGTGCHRGRVGHAARRRQRIQCGTVMWCCGSAPGLGGPSLRTWMARVPPACSSSLTTHAPSTSERDTSSPTEVSHP